MLIEIKDKDFMKLIPESNKKPVLVYFYAPWVTASVVFMPKINDLANIMNKFATFVSIDTEENIKMVQEFDIRTIPTLVVLRHGRISRKITGLITEKHIKKAVQDHL